MKRLLVSTSGWALIFCLLAAVSPLISPHYYEKPASPVIMIVAGLGFFFVLVTSSIRPVPWWRSLGIVVVGLGVIAVVQLAVDRWEQHIPGPHWGFLLAVLSSAGLLLVAALEIGQVIKRLLLSTSGWPMRLLLSTSGWAMILCLLAAVSPLMPWGHVNAPPRGAVWYSDGSLIPAFPGGEVWASGYGGWHGPVINIVAGLGFFFVFATSAIRPVPWWRSLGISVVGVDVIVIVLLHRSWCSFPIREWGPLLAMLSSAGLVPIAAMEIRHLIASRITGKPQQ